MDAPSVFVLAVQRKQNLSTWTKDVSRKEEFQQLGTSREIYLILFYLKHKQVLVTERKELAKLQATAYNSRDLALWRLKARRATSTSASRHAARGATRMTENKRT